MKNILIYDDNERWSQELKQGLEALPVLREFQISTFDDESFKESMNVLQKRRRQVREEGNWSSDLKTKLDEVSIFVIDYDLFDAGTSLTGEDVAYSVRCFSTCGLIVALNQYYEVDFDLTLKGHPESFADLNITGEQLKNSNLWGGDEDEFHPWYWPLLPQFEQSFEQRVDDVEQNLEQSICKVLGFEPEPFDILPRSISQFIGAEPPKTTFGEFVKESGNGMRPHDSEKANNKILARVGAARISKWLERLVLPELDILVDAPHLVSRYPSLMDGDKNDIKTWNKTALRTSHTELGVKTEIVEAARFKKVFWLSRPVWFWDKVRECDEIPEVREPWETFRPDWVFCEDISEFHHQVECREFVAKVESPFARRYVKELSDVNYQPKVRFAY